MSHGYHPETQREDGPVLWDGCDECEERAATGADAVVNCLDPDRFRRACRRAWKMQTAGLDDADMFQTCERQTIWFLAAVLVQLERSQPAAFAYLVGEP